MSSCQACYALIPYRFGRPSVACVKCRPSLRKQRVKEYAVIWKRSDSGLKATRRHKSARRAKVMGTQVQPIDPLAVFERDRWKCRLCGAGTPKRLRGTIDPRAPELDHIVPLALGGTHTWGNVQCACRKCNGNKGATALGQIGFDFAA